MNKKITKAVIPVAGKGTRFLPVTKGVLKTMFPIINKPTIQYLIEEVVNAGIKDIIIVISESQSSIKDYFDLNSKYYDDLKSRNKEIDELDQLLRDITITFVVQPSPKGLGDALLCCENLLKDEDFALLLGDDLVMKEQEENYGIKDLIDSYNHNPAYYIGVKQVPWEETHKYGIVSINDVSKIMLVNGMIEKPKENPPSNFAGVGRYILRSNVFDYLKRKPYDGVHEVQLTDAFIDALQEEHVYAIDFNGTRFDVGDHAGYVKASIAFALREEKIKDDIEKFIREMINK